MSTDLGPEDVDALATSLVVSHQRRSSGDCLCGPMQLGSSHSAHVVQALRRAGLLVDSLPTLPDFPIESRGDRT